VITTMRASAQFSRFVWRPATFVRFVWTAAGLAVSLILGAGLIGTNPINLLQTPIEPVSYG
jgi:hypothetical protein